MNHIILYKNFNFVHFHFSEYHYTENRAGSPMYYLACMLKGRSKIVSKNITITVNEGDVFYIPKGLPYQSYWYGQREIGFLSYGFSELEACDTMDFDLQVIPCPEVLKLQVMDIHTDGHLLKCKTLGIFYDVLSKLIPYMQRSPLSKKDEILKNAKNYILSNPDCRISEVADACYISEPYLYAIFKEKTDDTPNDFRLKVLCQKGLEYLTTTDKTVEEISSLIGLSSASHFRKILKKYAGASPREIRKNNDF